MVMYINVKTFVTEFGSTNYVRRFTQRRLELFSFIQFIIDRDL